MDDALQLRLSRLVALAMEGGPQSRVAADFLLAWWDAAAHGGFDPKGLWLLDEVAAADLVAVLAYVARHHRAPTALMDEAELTALVRRWRPTRGLGGGPGPRV